MTTLAQRVAALFSASKHGKKDDSLPVIANRSDTRRRLRGKGAFQHFTVTPNEKRTRRPGRSRAKRNAARERAQA